jgi:DNA-binding CsgD family transcriptional regulator
MATFSIGCALAWPLLSQYRLTKKGRRKMERPILTTREFEVVRLLSEGCTYARIAQRLGISEHTVTSHIKNTYRKLEVHTAAAAVFRVFALLGDSSNELHSQGYGIGQTQGVS